VLGDDVEVLADIDPFNRDALFKLAGLGFEARLKKRRSQREGDGK